MAQELIARLRQQPDDMQAFASLRDHYERRQDWPSLANLLEGFAKRAPDPQYAAQAFSDAGDVVFHYLGDTARALALYERALERDPAHPTASARVTEVIERSGDTNRLLDHLQRRAAVLGRAGDKLGLAQVELRIGQLYEHTFARPDRAIAHYRKAFEADPTLVAAIYAAREIYRGAGNPKAAATLFNLEIKAEPELERRIALLRELAHLRANELNDLHGGIEALGRALEERPGDLAVMHELATMLLQRADQRGAGPAADQERARAADLMYQLAQGTPPEHAMAYCETALDAVPAHDGALELLEHLASEHGREDLLPIRWVGYLQAAPDAPGAPLRRRQLGFAYLDAGQTEDAMVCLEPLLELGDAEVAEVLIPLFREQGRDEDATYALSIAVAGLPPERRLPRLREIIESLVKAGDVEQAMQRAHEVLAIEPGDPEALGFLEKEYRSRKDDLALRDLMLEASRVPDVSPEVRKRRLREVAKLSEESLDDLPGAIAAWRAITTVDPTDMEASAALAERLEQAEQWDELVQVLDRQAITETDPDTKVATLMRLALVHRDRRDDVDAAVDALRAVLQIEPDDPAARDALCDALLLGDAVIEAVPLLEARIDDTSDRQEKLRLLEILASTYEARLGDDERAFSTSARILDEDPSNLAALDRMERVDSRSQNISRLLETLAYRAEVVPREERADILVRIGSVADESLGDLDRAADTYQQALDLAPDRVDVLDALVSVYDRAGRYKDLVVLLRERAKLEESPVARAELYRRIARTLRDRVQNDEAAAEAWTQVLEAGEDEEALRALADRARAAESAAELEALLARLIDVVADDMERRDLALERAQLLHGLERTSEAAAVLRTVVLELDPQHLSAMQLLTRYCEADDDLPGAADALERQLALLEDPGMRLPVAQKLAELYEGPLDDTERAILALYAWIDAEPNELEPRERAAARLETTERHQELVQILDGIAQLTTDDARASEVTRRAAEVAAKGGDIDGAWARLEPRVLADAESERMLRELADQHGRHEQLADLFCRLAKRTDDPAEIRRWWSDAATVFGGPLADPTRALEAMLRAYATDLADEGMLGEVERLSTRAGAYARLAQVYERLLRSVESTDGKIKLLLRHAKLLDEHAGQPSEALDRVFRACAMRPEDDSLLATAEELAPRAGRGDELLHVYDVRRSKAADDAGRVDALLRAARLCDRGLRDRERAFQYIAQAVALTVRTPELSDTVEDAIDELDRERPELGNRDATRTLVQLYAMLAEDSEDDPRAGATLLLRGARLLEERLTDPQAAIASLEKASTLAALPHVLDALEAASDRLGRDDELDRHLEHLIEEALDSATAADLLRRRGRRLEEKLGRYEDAADVFRQLISVRRDDHDAADHLIVCLRKAGKHQDMLIALDREIRSAEDPERKLQLMREVASVWEKELANKWEAIDAYKKILKVAPGDAEATAAIERLGAKSTGDEGELLADVAAEPAEPVGADLATGELSMSDVVDLGTGELEMVSGEVTGEVSGEVTGEVTGEVLDEAPPFADDDEEATVGATAGHVSGVDALLEGATTGDAGTTGFDDETAYEGGLDEGSVDSALSGADALLDSHTTAETEASLDEEFPAPDPTGGGDVSSEELPFAATQFAGASIVEDPSELGTFGATEEPAFDSQPPTAAGSLRSDGVVKLIDDDEPDDEEDEASPFESVPPPPGDFRGEGTVDLAAEAVEAEFEGGAGGTGEYEDVMSIDGMDLELLDDPETLDAVDLQSDASIEELDAEMLEFEELDPDDLESAELDPDQLDEAPPARSIPPPPPRDD